MITLKPARPATEYTTVTITLEYLSTHQLPLSAVESVVIAHNIIVDKVIIIC